MPTRGADEGGQIVNFEKYTERSRGFVQSAQGLALRSGHQRFTPEHLLKVLLDDSEGLAANLIRAAGGDPAASAGRRRARARQAAQGRGQRRRPGLSGAGDWRGVFASAEEIAEKAGDSYVTAERLLLALALAKGTPAAEALAKAGVTPQALNGAIEEIRKGRKATSAERRSRATTRSRNMPAT